jgi:hypothetical protein
VAQILKRIGTTEATNLLATEYSDVDYENSIYYEDFSEDQKNEIMLIKILQLKLSSIVPSHVSNVNGIKVVRTDTIEERDNKEDAHDLNDLIPSNDIPVCSDEISLTRYLYLYVYIYI